ncbi:lipopolysaccharide kinase InaA family protein [Shimia sp. SDUM112013]|uniref:lipopolysaccharide kinase InaA family protein n=1 Tax=Shimia sp. SDUM112013 TaxID=3136160 RepID=UPI0032EB1989
MFTIPVRARILHAMSAPDTPTPSDTEAQLLRLAQSGTKRIEKLSVENRTYWVKRREQLSLSLRLRKGNADRAFERERAALKTLSAAGLPVAGIVAEGPDFFVTPDSGVPLSRLLAQGTLSEDARQRIIVEAARGLAQFHTKGVSHGHPRIKDVCWNAAEDAVCFIDLERFDAHTNTPKGHARDIVVFFYSLIHAGVAPAKLDAAKQAYLAQDTAENWELAKRYCRKLVPLEWLTRPLQHLPKGKGREFKTIPRVMAFFLDQAAGV